MPQTSRRDGIKRLWKIEEKCRWKSAQKNREREKKMKINLKKCFTPRSPIPGTIVFGVHVIRFHVDRY